MKILVLGATGRTGKLVLKTALDKGLEVNCLSRNIDRIEKRNGLTLFEGNPSNETDLEKAIAGCDGIISVLNISRVSDFPWSKLRTPKNYLSDVMKILIPLAEKRKVKRLVVCSAWGVAETKKDIPKWFNWFIENSNIKVAYQDHERQEDIISGSNLNWTIVRPVGLTNSGKQDIIESANSNLRPKLIISRSSVANFLVECLERKDLIGKKIVISKK